MNTVDHYITDGVSEQAQITDALYYSRMRGSVHRIHYHKAPPKESCPGLFPEASSSQCFVIRDGVTPLRRVS